MTSIERPTAITKTLSANDTGETGAHQAGMLIQKDRRVLSFFPRLDESEKNPRIHFAFIDDTGTRWELAYIYYNNIFFGGTRNEYRLTRMTPYIRANRLKAGDQVTLSINDDGQRYITFRRKATLSNDEPEILRLGSAWRVIDI